jgi:DNA repair photolyase
MTVLYKPEGAAAEYAPLAVNLYRGCAHGCRYCYAPNCLRFTMTREQFLRAAPRADVLARLGQQLARQPGRAEAVLLCFTCDPYQPLERDLLITHRAIGMLAAAGYRPRLLTKSVLAARDFDVMRDAGAEFGMSLVWSEERTREHWEPGASTIQGRLDCLAEARGAGLTTWISMEPVIDPEESLRLLEKLTGRMDVIKIGKVNHWPALEREVDWGQFLGRALKIMAAAGQAYYIKRELWRFAAPATRAEYPQERG